LFPKLIAINKIHVNDVLLPKDLDSKGIRFEIKYLKKIEEPDYNQTLQIASSPQDIAELQAIAEASFPIQEIKEIYLILSEEEEEDHDSDNSDKTMTCSSTSDGSYKTITESKNDNITELNLCISIAEKK
jgi:hypothetical protein